jgi:glycosyltransferase involved in cell wall biosynthesis
VIPCFNEELAIADVVGQFRAELPEADIYVFDNNSSDNSVELARTAGARVVFETRQGKGYVVQSIFRKVNADIYVMIDGDGTYPVADVHRLLAPILAGEADMVVGSRLHPESASQFKSANRIGNKFFRYVLRYTLGANLTDMLSGYRVFTREFVKGVPLFGGGFETETELTIKALERGFRIVELPISLSPRADGSSSKIRIVGDGFLILTTILSLFRDHKPLTYFGTVGLILLALSSVPSSLFVFQIFEGRQLLRVVSAASAVGFVIAGMLSISVGLVLHTIVRRSQQLDHQLRVLTEELHSQFKQDLAQMKSRDGS